MQFSTISALTEPLLRSKSTQAQQYFYANKGNTRRRQNCRVIRCHGTADRARTENYYELLGISADSKPQAIREAYRKLQKKHHPDIAGQKGHEYTLLLNEAYNILMIDNLRKEYDASIGEVTADFGKEFSGSGYSSWNGPVRAQALFVDENLCVGCRECVHHACKTFVMDETLGSARVKVQFGDDAQKMEVAVESCPVNCIHWVDTEELAVLEFLNLPRPKEAYGMFGGGWDRPTNVFMAAKFFIKQLKEKDLNDHAKNVRVAVEEETPAQAEARARATIKLQMEKFSKMWSWVREIWLGSTEN